ncbi:Glutamine transport ATP-binding protein GlnQ [wastewater metagenome]|uniref:Glutamine transport ATP-binding protein GlnQ n=2 Tax=unclassified sequences TaxID=12908 RepID=A0A5B8RGV5_9ZZZZ|nr:glutamine transport ATP-binding protein GlnQ [uncultured organism]
MIHTESLAMTYPGGVTALTPTSVRFERGAVTVLLGPSGAGKSTLLHCLNRLRAPTGGRVVADGVGPLEDAAAIRRHRRRTAMIFQQHQLLPRVSVLRNTLIGRLGHHGFWRSTLPLPAGERRLALDSLERVGLLDKALVRADQLSGGQQQRVGIARALTQQAELVLADEPVASLDPGASRQVLSLLRDVCTERGLTAVISLHQVEYTREFADRVIALADGGVVFDGPPTALDDDVLCRVYGPGAVADLRRDAAGAAA